MIDSEHICAVYTFVWVFVCIMYYVLVEFITCLVTQTFFLY